MQLLHSSWEGRRYLWFGASWSPMASWSPRCMPDACQMPAGCLPDVSQMPPRCLPDPCFQEIIWLGSRAGPGSLVNHITKTVYIFCELWLIWHLEIFGSVENTSTGCGSDFPKTRGFYKMIQNSRSVNNFTSGWIWIQTVDKILFTSQSSAQLLINTPGPDMRRSYKPKRSIMLIMLTSYVPCLHRIFIW